MPFDLKGERDLTRRVFSAYKHSINLQKHPVCLKEGSRRTLFLIFPAAAAHGGFLTHANAGIGVFMTQDIHLLRNIGISAHIDSRARPP